MRSPTSMSATSTSRNTRFAAMTFLPLVLLAAGCASVGASAEAPLPSEAEAARNAAIFEKFKALDGRWVQMQAENSVMEPGTPVVYETTAAGSAVVETVFPGSDHEMVTVYTLDRGRPKLTHYCAMQNQPTMWASPAPSDDRISFEATSLGNSASMNEAHMHWAEFHFVSPDRLDATWTVRTEDGTPGFVARMNLVRAE